MRIKNSTHWDSREIKRLVSAVMRHEKLVGRRQVGYLNGEPVPGLTRSWSDITVYVDYKRFKNRGTLGRAPYNGASFILFAKREEWDSVLWAKVIAHELAHVQGVHHRRMAGGLKWSDGWREEWAWAVNYPVTRKQLIPVNQDVARVVALEKKIASAEAHAQEWKRRAATAARRAEKWTRKVGRLSKQLAKAAQADEGKEP